MSELEKTLEFLKKVSKEKNIEEKLSNYTFNNVMDEIIKELDKSIGYIFELLSITGHLNIKSLLDSIKSQKAMYLDFELLNNDKKYTETVQMIINNFVNKYDLFCVNKEIDTCKAYMRQALYENKKELKKLHEDILKDVKCITSCPDPIVLNSTVRNIINNLCGLNYNWLKLENDDIEDMNIKDCKNYE